YPGGASSRTDVLPAGRSEAAIPYPEWVARDATGRFLTLFEPLVQRARRRLSEGLASLILPVRSVAELERLLLSALPMGLAAMLERTAVLELHVARHRGRVSGEPPGDRFAGLVAL